MNIGFDFVKFYDGQNVLTYMNFFSEQIHENQESTCIQSMWDFN